MKKLTYITLFFCLFGISNISKAQPPDPGGGTDPGLGCYPPPCVPIDGGLSWLLIAGAAYGGKKVYEMNKNEEV